jgi:hypothetical protein
MKYLLFILLLMAILITAGCTGVPQNPRGTPTPQIVYVTVLVTPTPTATIAPIIATSPPDCQCVLSGGCKEINSKIEELIGMRQNCAAEMVRRSKSASGGETNLSYYTSNNPACDAVSVCTDHCTFELQQHYDKVCLSGYQL